MEENQASLLNNMMTKADKVSSIREFIIKKIEDHPSDIAKLIVDAYAISRVTALKYLQLLIKQGIIEVSGKTKGRSYVLREIVDTKIPVNITQQTQEDIIWREEVKPLLRDLPENIRDICAHGFTEMFNNVLSHSQSSVALILIKRNAARIEITIVDKGIGIFKKIQQECHLNDLQHAILELAKGKLTTDPAHHSGEGIFFTSRMFNFFMIGSQGVDFMRNDNNDWIMEGEPEDMSEDGTVVTMEIKTNATQTAREVFDTYRSEFDSFGFSKTIIPLSLMRYEGEQLISRSQAKRLLARVDQFREIVLDFNGITMIGQAFADEIFRVYRNEHPDIHLSHFNASEEIVNMIKRVEGEGEASKSGQLFNEKMS